MLEHGLVLKNSQQMPGLFCHSARLGLSLASNRPIEAMYRAITRQIEVLVEPEFFPERSSPDNRLFFWAYSIVIVNEGNESVQLKTRHWIITDGLGQQQEVRGEGVVGAQPHIAPGERYENTNGVQLTTPSGFMTGSYQMVTESGEAFDLAIPLFSLDSPDAKRTLN